MTRRTGWTVAVLALALTACGSDAAPATSTVSPAELKAMLLTVDWLLDRCRTAINVMGDVTVSCLLDGKEPEAGAHEALIVE